MSKSDYLEAQILNHILRATAYPSPSAVYAALFTSLSTEAGPDTEVSGGSYVRQQITFSAPSGGQVVSDADVLFPIATADWGIIQSVAIMDSAAAGNKLYAMDLNIPREILQTDQFRLPAGQIIVQED